MRRENIGNCSRIIGLDISPECKKYESASTEISIGSQDDPSLIQGSLSRYPRIDLLLDDGSHMASHMIACFQMLSKRIHPLADGAAMPAFGLGNWKA